MPGRPFVLLCLLAVPLLATGAPQQKSDPKPELKKDRSKPRATSGKEAVPPEEDKAIATEEYAFNPLQARKELQTGNYYFKKGSFRAAAGRFREATKWDDSFGEAWLRLGEAEEKLKDPKAAKEAYAKYLATSADAPNAAEIRKRMEKLK
jgi:tetratricopeptide (TPR) repeat protein